MSDTKKTQELKNDPYKFFMEFFTDIKEHEAHKINHTGEYTWASAPCQAFSGTKNETIDIDYEEVKDETKQIGSSEK